MSAANGRWEKEVFTAETQSSQRIEWFSPAGAKDSDIIARFARVAENAEGNVFVHRRGEGGDEQPHALRAGFDILGVT